MALKRVDIAGVLRSAGDVSLCTEEGASVTGSVHTRNFDLMAHHGDLAFYKAVLEAVEHVILRAQDGSIHGNGDHIDAGGDIRMKASRDITEKSFTTRFGSGENYYDHVTKSWMRAGGSIEVDADGNVHFVGLTTHSGKDTTVTAGEHFSDEALAKEYQTVHRDATSSTRIKERTYDRPSHTAGGWFSVTAGGAAVFEAADITATSGLITAHHGVEMRDVHPVYEYEQHSHTKGGFLRNSKTVHEQVFSSSSVGGTIRTEDPFHIISGGDINLTHVHFKCPKVTLEALDGGCTSVAG